MRERRVLGWTARTSAAPPGPLILHAQRSSTARTYPRAIASKLWSEAGPAPGGDATAGEAATGPAAWPDPRSPSSRHSDLPGERMSAR